MGKLIKKQKTGGALVYLTGEVDEATNFKKEIDSIEGLLEVNCKDVSRINSAGLRSWVLFFKGLDRTKVKVRFLECSPALTQEVGFLSDFFCGWEVESLIVPFLCHSCNTETGKLFTPQALKSINMDALVTPCPSCGANAEFDDVPEHYAWLQK